MRNNWPEALYDNNGSVGRTGNERCKAKNAVTGQIGEPGIENNLIRALWRYF
jgi:hypothetical protein